MKECLKFEIKHLDSEQDQINNIYINNNGQQYDENQEIIEENEDSYSQNYD